MDRPNLLYIFSANPTNSDLPKIRGFVPESKVAPTHDLLHIPSTNPNNFRLDSEF